MPEVEGTEPYRMKNPVDLMEQLAIRNDWSCERTGDDEITIIVKGTFTDYHLSLNWRDDLEALHLACAFDFRVPENRLNEMYKLIAQINEQLWIGHFDLWTQEGLVMYRHALLLNGNVITSQQCEAMLRAALDASERYFKAYQFCVWAGKDSREALTGAMFETEGHA
ncbi:MAG: YbjN domain-containing protein [Pseudomonadota bacterium]